MAAIIPTSRQFKHGRGIVLLGVELRDKREEIFALMVCDGIALGIAYERAGFTSTSHDAPSKLWALPRVQNRAAAILEARRTTGVVTLPEVTDMLKRVYARAIHGDELNAAHNAAFSLARLYGHVTDRASVEIIRRPSRDPDAPSEQALGDWVAALPSLPGPGPEAPQTVQTVLESPSPPDARSPIGEGPISHTPIPSEPQAEPQGPGPEAQSLNEINHLETMNRGPGPDASDHIASELRPERENLNKIKGLAEARARASENGAPTRPVTGTPTRRARSAVLADEPTIHPREQKRVPPEAKRVPGRSGKGPELKLRALPKLEDLF